MPEIAGMSIGSWLLIIFLIIWAFVAIKVYFLGGFKKRPKGTKAHIGAGCCSGGDEPMKASSGCEHCAQKNGCASEATRNNAVMPTFKEVK
jgi:hypothetical protein